MEVQCLIDAVVRGEEASVAHLLNMGIGIHACDSHGLTVLHWSSASLEGEALVPFLLSVGAKLDVRDKLGHTPLHLHCAQGRIYGVSCLLHQGCDTNPRTHGTLLTPLHLASAHNHTEVARLLVAYGAKPNLKNADGKRANDIWTESA